MQGTYKVPCIWTPLYTPNGFLSHMHTINLETFNQDRLLKSVDPKTMQMGKDLYQKGAAQVIELLEMTARCVVQDKRNYHIQFKVSKQHLYLYCSCSHAARGLICEHDVAAWFAVFDRLTQQIPPEWRQQADRLITANTHPLHHRPAPYLLFYSLQKDLSTGLPSWRIMPHGIAAQRAAQGYSPVD